jgi:predicted nucleic acid-binding protein
VFGSSVNVVAVTRPDEVAAEEILRRYDDKRFTYTDATSFVVIERLGVDDAFTFDRNFSAYGRIAAITP